MPRIERLVANTYQLGRRASPGDFGSGQGSRALAGAVNDAGEAASAYLDASQRSTVSREVAVTSKRLAESEAELQERLAGVNKAEDPFQAIEDLRTEYAARAEEIRAESRERIRFPQYQQLYDQRTTAVAGRFGLAVNERARARSLERIRAQTITSVDTLTGLIESAENDDVRRDYLGQIRETLDEAVASGAYTADQAARVAAGADEQLERSESIATAQRGADEIIDDIQSPQERLRVARERYSGEQRDRVVARIKDRNAEDAAIERETARQRFDAAVTQAQAGDLSREQALELGLSGRELNTVISVIDQRQSGTSEQSPEDFALFYRLRAQARNPGQRSDFVDADLLQFAGRLTRPQLQELQDLQIQADSEVLDSYEQKVDLALGTLRLPRTPQQMEDAREGEQSDAIRFRRLIDAEKRRRESALGRRLTGAEQNDLIDFALEERITNENIFGSRSEPRFLIEPEDIVDIPEDAQTAVRDAIRAEIQALGLTPAQAQAQGIDPNDRQLRREVYQRMLLRGDL